MDTIRQLSNTPFVQNYRSAYNAATTYSTDDNVLFGNALWQCIRDNTTNVEPTEGVAWTAVVVAQQSIDLLSLLTEDNQLFFNFRGELVPITPQEEGTALGVFGGRMSFGTPPGTAQDLEGFTVSEGDLPAHLVGRTSAGELAIGGHDRLEMLTSRQRHGNIVRVYSNEVTTIAINSNRRAYLVGKRIGSASSDFYPEIFHNNEVLDVALAHTGDEATIEQEKALVVTANGNIQGIGTNNDNFALGASSDANLPAFTDIVTTGNAVAVFIARNNSSYFYIDNQDRVFAWGHNMNGELGIGTSSSTPAGLTQITNLSTSGGVGVRSLQFSGTYGSTKRSIGVGLSSNGRIVYLFGSTISNSSPIAGQPRPRPLSLAFSRSPAFFTKLVASKTGNTTESLAVLDDTGAVAAQGSSAMLGVNRSFSQYYSEFGTNNPAVDIDFMSVAVTSAEEGCLLILTEFEIWFVGRGIGNIQSLGFVTDGTDRSDFVTTTPVRIYRSQIPMQSIVGCDFESDSFSDAYAVIKNVDGTSRVLGWAPHFRPTRFACMTDVSVQNYNSFVYRNVRV